MALPHLAQRGVAAALLAVAALTPMACGGDGEAAPTASPAVSAPAPIEAFRYRLTMTLEESDRPYEVIQQGEVILPDREHATQAIAVGSWEHESERLTIAGRDWVRGDLPWIDLAASPLEYLGAEGAFSAESLEGLPSTEETVDGVAAHRYEFDGEDLRSLLGNDAIENPDGTLHATLWFAPDLGVPVALELVGDSDKGYELRLRLQVFDVNASDIVIEEP